MIPLEIRELVPESPYLWRARNPGHSHRLICFPHAGAGAAAYADWAGLLPPEIELVAVQLPGRQNRIAEEPFSEAGRLVSVLTHALRPVLDRPFAFFGHSGGAALAYELAKALRARGSRGPERLFLSARPAPDVTGIRWLHDLPHDEFRAEVLALGGIDPEIAADDDVMATLLPLLRADFGLWERHVSEPGSPLDCPITVLCGESDPRAPLAAVDRWRAYTTAEFSTQLYPGGHFYFLDSTAEVVSSIGRQLLERDSQPRPSDGGPPGGVRSGRDGRPEARLSDRRRNQHNQTDHRPRTPTGTLARPSGRANDHSGTQPTASL